MSDPMLSYISSYLASHPRPHSSSLGSTGGSSATEHSGSVELATNMRSLLVAWEDLEIEKPIGRGSFGTVRRTCSCRQVAGHQSMHAQSAEPSGR